MRLATAREGGTRPVKLEYQCRDGGQVGSLPHLAGSVGQIPAGPSRSPLTQGVICRQTGVSGKPEKAAAGVPRAEITSGGVAR